MYVNYIYDVYRLLQNDILEDSGIVIKYFKYILSNLFFDIQCQMGGDMPLILEISADNE